MEHEDKAESMRKWRETQKEKKRKYRKAFYEKNKARIAEQHAQKKKRKADQQTSRATRNRRLRAGNNAGKSSMERVKNFRQKRKGQKSGVKEKECKVEKGQRITKNRNGPPLQMNLRTKCLFLPLHHSKAVWRKKGL